MSRICIGDHRITIREHGMLIQDVEAYVGNDSRIIEDSNFMELITDYLEYDEYVHWTVAREYVWRACEQANPKACIDFDNALIACDYDLSVDTDAEFTQGFKCEIEEAASFYLNKRQLLAMQALYPKSEDKNMPLQSIYDITLDKQDTVSADDIVQFMKVKEPIGLSQWLTSEGTNKLISDMSGLQGVESHMLLQLNANKRPRVSSRIHVSLAGHFAIWLAGAKPEYIARAQKVHERIQAVYIDVLKERNKPFPILGTVYVFSTPELAAKGYFGLGETIEEGFCIYREMRVLNGESFISRVMGNLFAFHSDEYIRSDDIANWLSIPWPILLTELEALEADDKNARERVHDINANWSRRVQPVQWDEDLPAIKGLEIIDE